MGIFATHSSSAPGTSRIDNYRLKCSTATDVLGNIVRVMGAYEGMAAWTKGSALVGPPSPGHVDSSEKIMYVLQKIAKMPGLTQAAGRSYIIRLPLTARVEERRRR